MEQAVGLQDQLAGSASPRGLSAFASRWQGRLVLLLIGTGLLTAAFAPVNQFYLAWVGLVPWLIVLNTTSSQRSAFFWSWLAGTLFFIANMWWMYAVTSYGMVALMAILGLYWGYAGIIIRGAGLLGRLQIGDEGLRIEDRSSASRQSTLFHPQSLIFNFLQPLLIGAIWIAASEWFRGTWPWHGLPWLYLGSTQTPALFLCQIADITGVAGLSFLIAAVNAWIALGLAGPQKISRLIPSGIMLLAMVIGVIVYGEYRLKTEPTWLTLGPKILVVQSNYPQDNTGAKGANPYEIEEFHFNTTNDALRDHPGVDLSVWSETMMPPLNQFARDRYRSSEGTHRDIQYMTSSTKSALLTGAESEIAAKSADKLERRNSAFFYDYRGTQYAQRYDKVHLVPYGEFTPFKDSVPWLYRLALHFGPPNMEAYMLVPGDEQHLTVFPLRMPEQMQPKAKPIAGRRPAAAASTDRYWHFVTPICFEDIDADICAEMFRPEDATPETKRADFLVNITNDGWFKANENSQHLQAAIFRSIENRVATARSVNTGISGFIDPLGHVYGLVKARTEGTSIGTIQIDPRVTFFTRQGLLFSWICVGITIVIMVAATILWAGRLFRRTADAPGKSA